MGCLGAGDLGGATSLVEILPPPSAPPFQTPSAIEPQCEHSQLRQVPPHIKALPDSILLGLAWDHPSAQIGSTRGTAPSKRNDLVTSRFKEFAQRREAMPRSDINTSLPTYKPSLNAFDSLTKLPFKLKPYLAHPASPVTSLRSLRPVAPRQLPSAWTGRRMEHYQPRSILWRTVSTHSSRLQRL